MDDFTANQPNTQPVFNSVGTTNSVWPDAVNAEYDAEVSQLVADGVEPEDAEEIAESHILEAYPQLATGQPVYDYNNVPDGFVKAGAYYCFHSAYLPVHEMAIAAGFAALAMVAGRAYTTPTGAGLNVFMSVIADTGSGKEAVFKTVNNLFNSVRLLCPTLEEEMIAANFASAQGAIKHLSTMRNPCCISFIDEYGIYLQRLNAPNLKDTVAKELSSFWLSAYGANEEGGLLLGRNYSDTSKNVANVKRPSVSLCGWSTPDNFYKGVDEENITDGMMPRSIFIHHKGQRPKSNKNRIPVPPQLQEWFRRIVNTAKEVEMANKAVQCRYASAEVEHMANVIEEDFRQIMNTSKDKVLKLLYNRAHLNILKIASLLAVARNHIEPYILAEHVAYAKWFVMQGIEDVIARFESGRVGQHVAGDLVTEQQRVLVEYIERYKKAEWSEQFGKSNRVTLDLFKNRIVNYHYFNVYVRNRKEFIKTGNSERALRDCLQWAVAVGILTEQTSIGKMYQIMPDGWNHSVPAAAKPSPELAAAYFKEMKNGWKF